MDVDIIVYRPMYLYIEAVDFPRWIHPGEWPQ